jgi:hypothetical protein
MALNIGDNLIMFQESSTLPDKPHQLKAYNGSRYYFGLKNFYDWDTTVPNTKLKIYDGSKYWGMETSDMYVAVGDGGKIAYTPYGVDWTLSSTTVFGTYSVYGIVFGKGKFIAVGENGKIAYSNDYGITWTLSSTTAFGTTGIWGVTYGNGKFVAVGASGKIGYSTDGINWTLSSNTPFGTTGINAVAFGGNLFEAVS